MSVQETSIEWATHTVNFWEGCQKVGPGCDHCKAAGVAFLFKQWGEWCPDPFTDGPEPDLWLSPDGTTVDGGAIEVSEADCEKPMSLVVRMGKKKAGRELDGATYDEIPDRLAL